MPHWIICYRLVHKMNKLKLVKLSILVITILSLLVVVLVPKPDSSKDVSQEVVESPVLSENEETTPEDSLVVEQITTPVPEPVKESEELDTPLYTEEELEILSIIIYQEAGGDACSDDTRLKVGNVFLNRVNSPLFPDTFEGVATAKSQYGTLYWTGIKWPDRASNSYESHAVQRAYDTARRLLEGERVLPANVFWQAEFPQGDGTYCYQDGTYFCYSEVDE